MTAAEPTRRQRIEALANPSEFGATGDTPGASTDLEPIDFAALLELLDFSPDEHTALTVKLKAHQKVSKIGRRDDVIDAAQLYTDKDAWYGVNPTNCTRVNGARGRSDEVGRLAALPLDGDDKDMGRVGIDQVVAEIAELIGWPSAVVESGHGRQFLWPVDRSDAEQLSNAEAAALSERFGLLIARLAAAKRGKIDTVSDLARMFRVPGSTNRKVLADPRPVIGNRDRRGRPVKIAALVGALDAAKVQQVDPADAVRDVVSPPADWTFNAARAQIPCAWLASKVAAWPTDQINCSRHRWVIAAATHVHCCQRRGCIGDEQQLAAIKQALHTAFTNRLAEAPVRAPDPADEFEQCWNCGESKAARKTDAEVRDDTSGEHHHDLAAGADAEDDMDFDQYRQKRNTMNGNGNDIGEGFTQANFFDFGTSRTSESDKWGGIDGASFILDAPTDIPAIWGSGNQILWPEGEGFMLAGGLGLGKTGIAGQLVRELLGLGDGSMFGLPVNGSGEVILYLAMDRPRQIQRSMGRQFSQADRDILKSRLIIRPGPPPQDIARHPEILAEMAEHYGAGMVVVDSMKDAALGLSDDEVGAGYNRARQLLLAAGRQLLDLHHVVKRNPAGGAASGIADIYGSTWLTSGCGSVGLLMGEPGDPIIKLRHVRAPLDEVGPLTLIQDSATGLFTVHHRVDLLGLAGADENGVTAKAAAVVIFDTDKPTAAQTEKARRRLDELVTAGQLSRQDGRRGRGATSARWYPTQQGAE
jgi:hypothetical protein